MEKNTDYQIGEYQIENVDDPESNRVIGFDFETVAVFKRLADDIYESKEAGIREPLQNAITAVKRAIREEGLNRNQGVVEIEVIDGEKPQITIQDNGIGIDMSVLENVLSVIGRSQNRDSGDLSGKYGMGFLSFYKLVGTGDGGFWMFTKSRKTDGETIKGTWKPSGFVFDEEDRLPDRFDEDEYGTRFELYMKDNISAKKIRDWVEKHAEWSTVPIKYEEYNSNGSLEFQEDYGNKHLKEQIDDSGFGIEIDNEYFTAVSKYEMSNIEKETLLLNSPIRRNSKFRGGDFPFPYSIRLKNENGVVVKGEHEGLMPVSESEYDQMNEKRKKKYIPESDLNNPVSPEKVMEDGKDVCLPTPTGSRTSLEKVTMFWSYTDKILRQKLENTVFNLMDQYDTRQKLNDGDPNDIESLIIGLRTLDILNSLSTSDTVDHIRSEMKKKFNYYPNKDVARTIKYLNTKVTMIKEGAKESQAQREHGEYVEDVSAYTILNSYDNVYMGVSVNKTKMEAVWSQENSAVVRVEESNVYDPYQECFSWRKLRKVRDYVDGDNLNSHIKKRLLGDSNNTSGKKPVQERNITIHRQNSKDKVQVKEIPKYLSDDEVLIPFPSNSDYKVSQYYDITSEYVSVAKCLVKMWNELKHEENIYRFDQWTEEVMGNELHTSEGNLTVSEIKSIVNSGSEDVVFHQIDSNYVEKFRSPEVISELSRFSFEHEEISECIYIPLEEKDLAYTATVLSDSSSVYSLYEGNTNLQSIRYPNDLYMLVWSKIPEWRDTPQIKAVKKPAYSLTDDWVDRIEDLSESELEQGVEEGDSIAESYNYVTDSGDMSIQEMIDSPKQILLHVLSNEVVETFRNEDLISDVKDYVYKNEVSTSRYNSFKTIRSTTVQRSLLYVPVTIGEALHIKEIIDGDSSISIGRRRRPLRGKKKKRRNYFIVTGPNASGSKSREAPSNTEIYGYAKLDKEEFDMVVPNKDSNSVLFEEGGQELIDSL